MFIDRKDEVEYLEREFKEGGFKFISIIGRRRVGKTRLIKKFLENKKEKIYFYIPDANALDLRLDFSKAISEVFKISFVGFPSWDEILSKLFKHSTENRAIVVLDEFQRFEKIDKSVPSIFQKYIDEHKDKSKMFLVVLGSSIGMMHKLFDHSSALYGRRTGQINLSPFSYRDVREWFKGTQDEKIIEIYAAFGGTPKYLEEVNSESNLFENVRKILSNRSLLYTEPELLIKTELMDPGTFFDILKQISFGKCTPTEIGDTLSIRRTSIAYYLDILSKDLDIIERRVPITEKHKKSKMGRYFLKDNFFRFWFRYVFPNFSALELDLSEPILRNIRKEFDSFVGRVFESVCRELLIELNRRDKLPFKFTDIGPWWDRKGNEIDIVSLSKNTKEILFGECKWQNRKVDLNVLENLRKKTELVNWYNKERKEYFALFSKSGFKKSCLEYCRENGILSFDLNDIQRSFRGA